MSEKIELENLRKRVKEFEALEYHHKKVEEALRESELRYRLLVKQSSDGVYLFDPDSMKILEANDQFLRMVGYDEREITMLTLADLVLLDEETIKKNIKQVLRDGKYVVGLRRYKRKDGGLISVEISSSVIRYSDARVVMVNIRDVSERIMAEKELQKRAAMLRDQAELLDVTEDAIIVLDLKDRIIFWNKGAEDRYGWTKKQALGKIAYHLLKTEFPRPCGDMKNELLAKGWLEEELVHHGRYGKTIIVLSRWALRRDASGKPVAILEINNDITAKKQAEKEIMLAKEELEQRVKERTTELQDANERLVVELARKKRIEEMLRKGAERYKNLFENSPIGIYRINPDGKILMANPTLIRMMGYASFNEFVEKQNGESGYEPSYLQGSIKEIIKQDDRVRGFQAKWLRPDGSVIFVRENAKAVRGADGNILFYEGTVEDISEGKKAEEEIRLYQEQLRSLASELSLAEERERRRVATLLHDNIGQTLAVIKIKLGVLSGSQPSGGLKEDICEIQQYIEQSIQYTRSLTFELSPPVLYELGLESALEWLAEEMQKQHGIRFDFITDYRPKPLTEDIRVFLFTAVRELLVNAAKHSRAGSVRIALRRKGNSIVISVEDDGKGFIKEGTGYSEQNKGYGLFSIRERLHHLGGKMDIQSRVGKGTKVVMTGPLLQKNRSPRSKNERQDSYRR